MVYLHTQCLEQFCGIFLFTLPAYNRTYDVQQLGDSLQPAVPAGTTYGLRYLPSVLQLTVQPEQLCQFLFRIIIKYIRCLNALLLVHSHINGPLKTE